MKGFLPSALMVVAWLCGVLAWHARHRAIALPALRRWAAETGCEVLDRGGWGIGLARCWLRLPPSSWRGGYPFRVRARTADGEVQEGWVLCTPRAALAIWDSGRIRETTWEEEGGSPEKGPPEWPGGPGLWDQDLDAQPGKRRI